MTIQQVWEQIVGNWWWIHFVLLGLFVGSSFGLWAYRDLWYSVATVLHGPSATRTFPRLIRQWFSALILALPSTAAVALFLTTPRVYRQIPTQTGVIGAISAAAGIWVLLRIIALFVLARGPQPDVRTEAPRLFRRPMMWARYRSAASPDSVPAGKIDALLGLLLHGGLIGAWYYLQQTGRTDPWWATAYISAAVVWCLLLTSLSVLINPASVSHE